MDKLEIKAAFTVSDAGEITGVAWPLGSPDSVGDVIHKGAFTVAPALPILFEHDPSKVVGAWESVTETDEGLQVKGRLYLDSIPFARDVRDRVRARRANGLSIGFRTLEQKARPNGRDLISVYLAECSIVANPSHPGARILTVKSADGAAQSKGTEMPNENTAPAPEYAELEKKVAAVADEVKTVAKLTERFDKLEAKLNRPSAANSNVPAADNDNVPLETKAFSTFARRGVERMGQDEIKALTVSVDANGGYLAPEDFGNEILKKIVEFSPIRAYAKLVPISAAEVKLPRRLTGTAATWVAEIDDRTASGMTFEQATFTPYELATYTDISTQLLEDNVYNLEGELQSDFAESFGKTEAGAFVTGDGTGKPKGLLSATGIAEIKTGNAATLGTDPAATIIGMFHSVPSVVAQNAVWLMNRKTLGALRTLKDATGRFIMLDPITAGAPVTLLGRPIVEAVDMPDIAANAYPIMLGDLSGYRIVDRIGLSVLRDPFSLATKGQVRFHARKRVGGDVTHADRFLKLKVAA
ncbi:MAG: phage major capsid protein [Mesorhizobium sp.]|uniref:phage major capsid protein n=1 Tax=Mesorhizobium sp. TaxID=1871066 RepID=UPI000FE9F454|nr:phage major capsid protein [Mesorhizobium sp.]RWB08999.1 MAG: phage major capsid protein [Mesorhizobium sp.]RWB17420.1 MAG: phage major capsid protein [Mesorhizobium sp.]